MFGLESNKKSPIEEFVFELEKELKDPKKNKELVAKVENRLQKIKEALRIGGDNPEEFQLHGALLNGYNAILKVFSRVTKSK